MAWVLLLLLVGAVLLQQVLIFTGCTFFRVEVMCAREGQTLAGVSGEVLAAVALLIALGKRGP
jgi:hypothetical protein